MGEIADMMIYGDLCGICGAGIHSDDPWYDVEGRRHSHGHDLEGQPGFTRFCSRRCFHDWWKPGDKKPTPPTQPKKKRRRHAKPGRKVREALQTLRDRGEI